jgi:3-deoxy-D-manno-octulosonic-acid transferase
VLSEQGALTIVRDAAGLAAALERLLTDREARAAQGAAGCAAVAANRGALERVLGVIERLPATPGAA